MVVGYFSGFTQITGDNGFLFLVGTENKKAWV